MDQIKWLFKIGWKEASTTWEEGWCYVVYENEKTKEKRIVCIPPVF